MVITLDTRDARTLKGIEIAAGAAGWAKIRTKSGRKAYGIPASSNGNRYYIVDCQHCDCYDSATAGNRCKHQIAAQLYCALVKAVETEKKSGLVAVREDADVIGWTKRQDLRYLYTAADYDRVHADEMTDEEKRRIFGRL